MEVRFEAHSAHTHRIFNIGFVVYNKFLRQHMNNAIAGRKYQLVHVIDQPVNIFPADFCFHIFAR